MNNRPQKPYVSRLKSISPQRGLNFLLPHGQQMIKNIYFRFLYLFSCKCYCSRWYAKYYQPAPGRLKQMAEWTWKYIYIGRKNTHISASKLGNPFRIDRNKCRTKVINLYEDYLQANAELLESVSELKGRVRLLVRPLAMSRRDFTSISGKPSFVLDVKLSRQAISKGIALVKASGKSVHVLFLYKKHLWPR